MALKFLNDGYFAGKVGIGTVSPSAKLSINDVLGISGTGNNTYGQIDLVNTQAGTSGDEIGPFITFRGKRGAVDTTIAAYGAIGAVNTGTTGNSTGALTFLVKNAVGAAQDLVEQMRITTGGNVGIGTASPDATLDAVGSINVAGRFTSTATSKTNNTYTLIVDSSAHTSNMSTAGAMAVDVNSGRAFTINGLGNVGIGTDSPRAILDLKNTGDGVLNTTASNYQILLEAPQGTGDYGRNIGWAVGSGTVNASINAVDQGATNATGLAFSTGAESGMAERMRIDSSGQIIINNGDVTIGEDGQYGSGYGMIAFSGTTNGEPRIFAGLTNKNLYLTSGTGGVINFRTNGASANKMVIDSSGNVGIGTTSPTLRLDVRGTQGSPASSGTSQIGSLSIRGTGSHFISSGMLNVSPWTGWFQSQDANNLSTNYPLALNPNGGNVGIGTTSPDAKLEVESSTGGVLRLTSSDTTVLTGESIGKIEFKSNDASTGGDNVMGFINSIATNVGTRYALSFGTGDAAAAVERMNINNLGSVKFNNYDSTNNTGTATYLLGTDASGNVVKTTTVPSGSGGPYLPLSAGSSYPLTGDLYMPGFIYHVGDIDTYFGFGAPNVFDLATGGSRKLYADSTAVYLYKNGSQRLRTTTDGITVTGDVVIDSALLSNQENTDIDSAAPEMVAQVAIATYTAAFFDFVVKKSTNVRSGTVYACHDGTNVEFTETSTQDLGDTSDVVLSVDISGGNMRLMATVASDDWSVKSLIRAI